MQSLTFLGNTSALIDWDNVVDKLEEKDPDVIGPPDMRKGLEEVRDTWEKAGYKHAKYGGSVEWQMYVKDKSFDREIAQKIIEFLDIPHYSDCWISKIMPGKYAAPHFDSMRTDKSIYRIHVHIQDSKMGHVFYVNNDYITSYKKGDVYLWNNPYSWHGGMNCGLSPKYMFNLY